MESGGVKDKIRFFLSRAHPSASPSPSPSPVSSPGPGPRQASSAVSSTPTPSSTPPLPSTPFSSPVPTPRKLSPLSNSAPRPNSAASPRRCPSGSSLASSVSAESSTPSSGSGSLPPLLPATSQLETDRKSRFVRNLRFFKDASKQHISDFNRSPAGFKFRSSSDPDIHQQLSEEEEAQLTRGASDLQQPTQDDESVRGKEKENLEEQEGATPEDRRRRNREARRSRNRTLLPDFQCTTAAMSDTATTSNGVDNTPDDKESDNDRAKREGTSGDISAGKHAGGGEDTTGERSNNTSASSDGATIRTDTTAKNGNRLVSDVVVHVEGEPSDDKSQVLAKNMAARAANEALLVASAATVPDSNTKTRRKSVGEKAGGSSSQDQTGTAILYRVMSDGATQLQLSGPDSNGVGSSGVAKSEATPKETNGDKKASTDSNDRKKGGLIARYKNLVSTMEKDREKNSDALKSLTEGAVVRKKKKEKEREEREKEEGREEWEKGEGESKRKKRSGSARKERAKKEEQQLPLKKEETAAKKDEQQKKKHSNIKKTKKKKSMKESTDSTAGKKDKRSKKEARPGSMVAGATLLSSIKGRSASTVTEDSAVSGRKRPQEVDERTRECLRKLSMIPPPKAGEPGVSAIRRRMMNGDPFTVVIYEEVSWTSAGRGGQAKPSRSLGSKSSRIDTGDSLTRRPSSDVVSSIEPARPNSGPFSTTTKRSVASSSAQRHSSQATTGNESGSGKEDRKSSAPITLKAKVTIDSSPPAPKADIRLFGVDGELVIEESDDGEDWDKELKEKDEKKGSGSGGNHIKLVGPGGGLVVEESEEDEDWDKELQLDSEVKKASGKATTTSASKSAIGLSEAEAEEDEDDWDKEFGGKSPENANKLSESTTDEGKVKQTIKDDSDEDEDWDKELTEETSKKGDQQDNKAKTKECEIQSEDEDWDKELATEEEVKQAPSRDNKSLLASTETEEDDGDWDKEFAAEAEAPKIATKSAQHKTGDASTKEAKEKKTTVATEESEDEDWGKEFDQEEEKQVKKGSGKKVPGITLNLDSLGQWEEDKEEDWGDGFETEDEPAAAKPLAKSSRGAGEESNDSKSERTDGEDEDWGKAFGESSDGTLKKSSVGSKRRKGNKEKGKEKLVEKEKDGKKASFGGADKGSKREKRKRTKSSAARRIETQNRLPSPPHSTSTPSTPRSHTSSRVSSLRDLAEEEEDRKRDCASPPTGRFSVVKVQYLHSRSPKWIERERNARALLQWGVLGSDADKAMSATGAANNSIMASLSSFLSPRVTRKDKTDSGPTRLGQGSRSQRDLGSATSKDGSNLSSTTSAVGPYVPFHPPAFETVGWDPVLQQWSKRLCGAHYGEDLTVTTRLLGEDLILVYDQIFKFDDRGVLYSWNAGSKVRETNFYDVYSALVEKEGETCEEVGYLADL